MKAFSDWLAGQALNQGFHTFRRKWTMNEVNSSKPQPPIQVVLGSQTIKAYVAAPKAFNVLGIVRMGMEFGLLATNASGVYFRVNGSTSMALCREAVEDAIRMSQANGRGESYAVSRSQSAAANAPVVIVHRRRRHIEMPNLRPESAVNAHFRAAAA